MASTDVWVLSKWYSALYDGECLKLRSLLKDHPHLLKEGWKEDPTRDSRGAPLEEWKTKHKEHWMGCTVLHKAALRGHVELATMVVDAFNCHHEGEWLLGPQHSGVELSPSTSARPPTEGSVKKNDKKRKNVLILRSTPLSLGDLLLAKDGSCKLDALAMATINGNRAVVTTLVKASLKCQVNPYGIEGGWKEAIPASVAEYETEMRRQVRQITEGALATLTLTEREKLKFKYNAAVHFNFLPFEEFLFHSSFADRFRSVELKDKVQKEISKRIDCCADSSKLRRYLLLELQDGQGRSALHVAADQVRGDAVNAFVSLIPKEEDHTDWLNSPDGAGRTPLYRAAANGCKGALRDLVKDSCTNLNEKISFNKLGPNLGFKGGWVTALANLSQRNGFKRLEKHGDGLTALQIAIIRKQRECVEILLADSNNLRREEFRLDVCTKYMYRSHPSDGGRGLTFLLEPLQLAVMMGDIPIVESLLKDPRARDLGRPSTWLSTRELLDLNDRRRMPALHIAASLGKFDLVKVFLDKQYNIFVKDCDDNTAMHCVVEGRDVSFLFHLLHHVRVPRMKDVDQGTGIDSSEERRAVVHKGFIERQGCVELLLQAGFDLGSTNSGSEAPYPSSRASAEFLSWWYKKLAKETMEEQNTLNAAANAISVTAALVATASYVGPLQPPLNFVTNSEGLPSEIQVNILPVRIFIVCDTLSFYLAVAAIMLAVIPSLPIPHQGVRIELQHTRRIVALAVSCLFPSIVSVLIAFAAGSIAVIPNDQGSWNHGGLTISTSVVGGFICLLVIYLFFMRLLQLVNHKSVGIKKLYSNALFCDDVISMKWRRSRKLEFLRRKISMESSGLGAEDLLES